MKNHNTIYSLLSVLLVLCLSLTSCMSSPTEEVINVSDGSFGPASSAAVLISEQTEDINVIPDEYNTGCNEEKLTVVDGPGTYDNVYFKLVDYNTKLGLDFGYSNKNAESEIIISNYDFSKYPVVCRNENVCKKEIHVTFINCKFSFFGTGIGNSPLSYSFENCFFNNFYGSNASINNSKFGGSCNDCINPYSNVSITNCYFRDLTYFLESGEVHSDGIQTFGKAGVPLENITLDNCRFEIPAIKTVGNNASVNACLMFQVEYSDAENVHFRNTHINGGGYSIYARGVRGHVVNNISFENIYIGDAHLYGDLYPYYDETIAFSNVIDSDLLYVTSVWENEKNGISFCVTNDSNKERKLRVYWSETNYMDYAVPGCLGGDDLRYYKGDLKYSDFPFDIIINIPDAKDYVVCYDITDEDPSEENQIRFYNPSGKQVYIDIEEDDEIIVDDQIVVDDDNDDAPVITEAPIIVETPVVEDSSVQIISSGSCGATVSYTLTENGVLTLSGTGDTYSYHSQKLPPWYDNKDLIETVKVENGITNLGMFLFGRCGSLKEVVLPDTLVSIGNNVFNGCSELKVINLPDMLVSIGNYAFNGTKSLSEVYVSEDVWNKMSVGTANNTVYNHLVFTKKVEEPVITRTELSSGTCGISVYYRLYSDGVLEISGTGAMSNYNSVKPAPWYDYREMITQVVIEPGIIAIGAQSFRNCCYITEIAIPDGIEEIAWNSFIGCSGLKTVSVPLSVTSIGNYAFHGTSINKVIYSGTVEQWNSIAIGSNNSALVNSFGK